MVYIQSLQDDTLYFKNDTLNDHLKLSAKERTVLDEIAKNTDITITDIIDNTGFSRPTVTRAISALKEKGILAREGAKKNGKWKIQ